MKRIKIETIFSALDALVKPVIKAKLSHTLLCERTFFPDVLYVESNTLDELFVIFLDSHPLHGEVGDLF